jgi:hypothetical protein
MADNNSPSKRAEKQHTLKDFQKEDHDEHAPESVRDSEMHSEMVSVSHRKESVRESSIHNAATPQR